MNAEPVMSGTGRQCRPDAGRRHTPAEVESILSQVTVRQTQWAALPLPERARHVWGLADTLRSRRSELARLVTAEMGKPIAEAESEIDKCTRSCEHFAARGGQYLEPEILVAGFDEAFIRFDPLGVILAVMPWNFPFWQVIRLVAPAVLAGDTLVLKHASNVPQCAAAIENLLTDSGFPADVLRTVFLPADQVPALIGDDRIAMVCATASSEAGADIASVAGRHLKKQVLELGGSDAFVVLDDADLGRAVAEAVASRMLNAGQSCVAAKRFIVHATVVQDFASQLAEAVRVLRVGDPWDRSTQVGPLARADLVDTLVQQVDASVSLGANVLTGGHAMARPGNFYAPTVLAGVTPAMPVFREETFGPVAAVIAAEDDDAIVTLANDSVYGLGASIWTSDSSRAKQLAGRLQSGSVFVNSRVSSDPALPFGGLKRSGYGRELGSFGIRELTNVKTVAVRSQHPEIPGGERT